MNELFGVLTSIHSESSIEPTAEDGKNYQTKCCRLKATLALTEIRGLKDFFTTKKRLVSTRRLLSCKSQLMLFFAFKNSFRTQSFKNVNCDPKWNDEP
jgi:hypothetical protein